MMSSRFIQTAHTFSAVSHDVLWQTQLLFEGVEERTQKWFAY